MGNPQPNQAMSDPKSKRKAPAFQFYADDFLAGTLDMSQDEVGAYIRLLCHQWSRGSIPVETEKQQRLAGGSVSVDVLAKFQLCDDGLFRNARLESEREKQKEYRNKQREKGLKSALARSILNHGSTAVGTTVQPSHQPNGQPEVNSPSPSPSPDSIKDLGIPESMGTKVPRPRFVKPTLEQLIAESDKRGVDQIEAEKFLDYYEANGWKINRTPMVNWVAAFANWARRTKERPQSYQPTLIGTSTPSDAPF
jgi:hypothetical protein